MTKRNTLWICNVNDPSLFDANTRTDIPGLETKTIRAVVLAKAGDSIEFPPSAKNIFNAALQQRVLMGMSADIRFDTMRTCSSPIEWFYLGQGAAADAAVDRGVIKQVQRLTSKNEFVKEAREREWIIPDTVCIEDGQNDRRINPLIHRVFKVARSAGGVGVVVTRTAEEWTKTYEKMSRENTPFQIQEYLEDAQFYGVQYFKGESVITTQVLDGTHYSGTRVLDDEELADDIWFEVQPAVAHTASLGIPVFSLDVAVTPDQRVLLIECNPRYGASTYPWRLATKLDLPAEQWEYRYMPIRSEVTADQVIEAVEDLVYRREGNGRGLVIIDWGLGDDELGVLFIGFPVQRARLQAMFVRRLGDE